MFKQNILIALACFVVIAGGAAQADPQPQLVPRLSVRALDRASYVELAKQWKEYIEKNGDNGALVKAIWHVANGDVSLNPALAASILAEFQRLTG